MKNHLIGLSLLACAVSPAMAITVSYNTTGSTLSCNGIAGCSQNTPTSITDGGITLTYNTGSGSNVATDSFISLGNIVSSGSGSADFAGVRLTININGTPPGASGTLPSGVIGGYGPLAATIATNQSLAVLRFSPANTTTPSYGSLPGVEIKGGGVDLIFQIDGNYGNYGLVSPTDGNPLGEVTIGGYVSAVPEAASVAMMLAGIGALGAAVRRRKA